MTFTTTRKALQWACEASLRVKAGQPPPLPVEPTGRRQERVWVPTSTRIGDRTELLATLTSIDKALVECERVYPAGTLALKRWLWEGRTQAQIAEELHITQQALSVQLGRAEAFLEGALRMGQVVGHE